MPVTKPGFKVGEGFFMLFTYFAGMQSAGQFQQFIHPFSKKLLAINAASLPIADYSKRYLQHLLENHLYYLEIYASVLEQLLQHTPKSPAQIAMADFGSGNGLLGMFAKFAGFKNVWLCDMDAAFVQASQVLAGELDLELDGYVTGSIEELKAAVAHQPLDAVVGTDVIEHIYSIPNFLQVIACMNAAMVTVLTTASNPHNFLKCRKLAKLQLQDELQGSNPADFELAGPSVTRPFLQIRKEIIEDAFPGLPAGDLERLARATRGLIKADILEASAAFLQTGDLPKADDRWPNTCNPHTGTWTERILPITTYRHMYEANGFALQMTNGFHNRHAEGIKKNVNLFRNGIVKLSGKYAAPFITLIGYKSA